MKKMLLMTAAAMGAAILFFTAPAAFAYSIYPATGNSRPSTNTTATTSFESLFAPFQGFFSSMQSISPSDTEIQIHDQIQSTLPSLPTEGENILTSVVNFLSWIVNWLIYASNQFAGWAISVIGTIIRFR